jgi:CheY-like chemotaxis protein
LPSTILVADDEADMVSLTKAILKRGGYLVTTASDGEETLRKVEANNTSLAGSRCLSYPRYLYFLRRHLAYVLTILCGSAFTIRFGDGNGQ